MMQQVSRILFGLLIALSGPASAEYVIQPGDSVRLSFLGAPEADAVSLVDDAGMVRFRLVGEIQAAGLTLTEFESEAERSADGRSYLYRSETEELVTIDLGGLGAFAQIAEYRPVSVVGQVGAPGSIEYEPGMTILTAIARAGGASLVPGLADPAVETALDNLIEQQVLAHRIATLRTRIWRQEALIEGNADAVPPDLSGLAVNDAILEPMLENERNALRSELDLREMRRAALEDERAGSATALGLVRRQLEITEQLIEDARRSLERTEDLAERGLTQSDVIDADRRALALTNSQLVELLRLEQTFVSQIEQIDTEIAAFELEAQSEARDLLTELRSELNEASARRDGLRRFFPGPQGSAWLAGEVPETELAVILARDGSVDSISDLNARVAPGDVITVRFLSDNL